MSAVAVHPDGSARLLVKRTKGSVVRAGVENPPAESSCRRFLLPFLFGGSGHSGEVAVSVWFWLSVALVSALTIVGARIPDRQ